MAHNLYKSTMAASTVNQSTRPWHGLDQPVDHLMSIEEALSISEASYPVIKEPIYRLLPDGTYLPVDGQFITVNGHTLDVLGGVGKDYHVFQTADRLAAFGEIIDGKISTMLALGKGERFACMADLSAEIGDWSPLTGDPMIPYLLITGSHDGSLATQARFTQIRVVCQNTMNQSLRRNKATISIRTTEGAPLRLAEAVTILQEFKAFAQESRDTYSRFLDLRIDDQMVSEYLNTLVGDPTTVPAGRGRTICANKREAIIALYEGNAMGSEIPGVMGSLYGLFQATTEWADYSFPQRGTEDRANSVLFGGAFSFKQRAFDTALAVVSR